MKTNLKYCFIALLLAHFASLQWFVAAHRIAHVGNALSSGAHAAEHSHHPDDAAHLHAANDFGFEHKSKLDCDRFDACAAAELLLASPNLARFETPPGAAPTRANRAAIVARLALPKARGPPTELG